MLRGIALQMIGDRNQIISALGIILAKLKCSSIATDGRRTSRKGMPGCGFQFKSRICEYIRIVGGSKSNHLVHTDRKLRIGDIEILIRIG